MVSGSPTNITPATEVSGPVDCDTRQKTFTIIKLGGIIVSLTYLANINSSLSLKGTLQNVGTAKPLSEGPNTGQPTPSCKVGTKIYTNILGEVRAVTTRLSNNQTKFSWVKARQGEPPRGKTCNHE